MRHEAKKYLYDMQQACLSLKAFLEGKKLADYLQDELLRSAVERKLMILGEAVKQTIHIEPEIESQIPDARKIVDFRNILVHGYYAIQHETVWGVLQKDLPILTARINAMLAQ